MKIEITYPKLTSWQPTRINNKWKMARVDLVEKWVEEREIKWWEKIIYWKF